RRDCPDRGNFCIRNREKIAYARRFRAKKSLPSPSLCSMNRLTPTCLLLGLATILPACNSNSPTDRFSMGGVPAWIADGAKLGAEPEPYKPDPAIIHHEDESGPVSFELITDNRDYS